MTVSAAPRKSFVFATLAVAVTTLALAEAGARWLTRGTSDLEADVGRAENVHVFMKHADVLPAWSPSERHLLLIGNSHTYALPGLTRGQPLRPDPGRSLIDELGRRIDPDGHVQFHRLAYPNMLPFEMLLRALQLDAKGMRPDVVVLGLTWRNIARDRDARAQVRLALDDPADVALMRKRLASLAHAQKPVLDAFDAAAHQESAAAGGTKDAPASDRLEAALDDAASPYVALLGKNAELRAQLYRRFAYGVDRILAHSSGAPSYDVVESDLAFNLACLRTLFDLWEARGVRVLVYAAPERTDLPPVCDPARQAIVMGGLFADAERRGFVTLDAKHVVPNALWGFEMDTPDRSHFTEEGHQRLAAAIISAGDPARVFDALRN